MSITIEAKDIPQFRQWYAERGGVTRWENLEIASGHARELFTPADAPSPGWRYGRPTAVTPSEVSVSTPTLLEEFRGRFKRHYWGPGVAKATEAKAERIAAGHRAGPGDTSVVWTWVHDDTPGCVKIRIFREALAPLDIT